MNESLAEKTNFKRRRKRVYFAFEWKEKKKKNQNECLGFIESKRTEY